MHNKIGSLPVRSEPSARPISRQHSALFFSYYGSVYVLTDPVSTSASSLSPEPKNTSLIEGDLRGPTMAVNKDRWKEMGRDRNQGKVVFRLDVVSVIRFKVYSWHSKTHRMHANCYIEVGWDGILLSRTKDKRCPVYFT
ncbi:Late embryogenesis abundant (LEA) hydroxyproline-rich glycoprotein family [Raphanus sativus]|nr:Late embryogenesis abundant (LEA) hydroxyproline-rich glycoprotein family [Raphanus sativus]